MTTVPTTSLPLTWTSRASRLPAREALFRRLRAGDVTLRDFLDAERAELYDYSLRMTGDQTRTLNSLEEVITSIEAMRDDFADSLSLRVCVFRTMRSFNADGWKVMTSLLENPLLESSTTQPLSTGSTPTGQGSGHSSPPAPPPPPLSKPLERETREDMIVLDRALRQLPADEREAVLLVRRLEFSLLGAADVMGVDEPLLSANVSSGLGRIEAAVRESGRRFNINERLLELPLHPLPESPQQSSTNLSVIIHDLRETNGMRDWPWLRIAALFLLCAIGMGALWLWYQGAPTTSSSVPPPRP